MEKQHHLHAAEHPRSSYYYTPYIDVELQFDPLQADPLLQKSLVFDDSVSASDSVNDRLETDTYDIRGFGMMASSHQYQNKRKLTLTQEEEEGLELESSATSDTSGRFDDADEEPDVEQHDNESGEEKTAQQETHSAKRGRSNGWPLQHEIAYDENGMKIDLSGRRQSTPTPTKTSKSAKSGFRDSPVLYIRRSRFVEGSMNDRVSEKPPSIYLREEDQAQSQDQQQLQHNLSHSVAASATASAAPATGEKKNLEKRSSGIFRFGKAIASAFHPFGSRHANKSEVWKGSHDGAALGAKSQKEIMKQRQAKAEQAYAELKKSGYHGTGTNGIPSLNYNNYSTTKVDASIADETWKSIQEKMQYKMPEESRISQDDTLVAAPGIREEALTPSRADKGVSKLKSFSELRKRTSNLSIPAIRFRDASPMSSCTIFPPEREDEQYINSHRPVERRQSRKELNRQAKLMKRVSNLEDKLQRARRELREMADFGGSDENNDNTNDQTVPAVPPVPTICVDDEYGRKFEPGTLPTILSERLLDNSHVHVSSETETDSIQPEVSQKTAKWPPVDSLSRKRKSPAIAVRETDNENDQDHDHDMRGGGIYDADCGKPVDDNKSPRSTAKRVRNKLKSPRDKRASSLTTKASQRLKAKQTSRNLRQAVRNTSDNDAAAKDELRCLQEKEGNSSTPTTPQSSASKKKGGRTYYGGDTDYENVPPVPPVPQELLQGTETKKKSILKPRVPSKEFAWPEDIF